MAATQIFRKHSSVVLVVFGVLILSSTCGSALASSSPLVFADNSNQVAYLDALDGASRHLLQVDSNTTVPPNTPILLATSRTDRPNPLHGLKTYYGGYNLSSSNYGASVGYTGLPGWILAIVWTALGLLLLLIYMFMCCCCRHRTSHEYSHGKLGYILPIIALLIFTVAAIAGSILLYYAQHSFNKELTNTLDYVVNQSQITVDGLENVQSNLSSAANVDIENVFTLSQADKNEIASINSQLNSTANNLHSKTYDNRNKIKNAINIVQIVLIAVAAVMLALVLLGLLLSAIGIRFFVYLLILIGWVLVVGTWILCGIFIFLDNGIGDTCLAMLEWSANPEANTSLDKFLPCNGAAAAAALANSQGYTNKIVGFVDQTIAIPINQNVAAGTTNWYNQSGPLVPSLCQTVPCPNNTVSLQQAPQVWNGYICQNDSTGLYCTTQGRLTQSLYTQLVNATSSAYALSTSGAFLLNAADCTFIQTTFNNVTQTQCGPLRKHSKWIWIGLILISGGNMLSILLWLVFIRRKKYRYKSSKGEMPTYNGQSQPYSPTPMK